MYVVITVDVRREKPHIGKIVGTREWYISHAPGHWDHRITLCVLWLRDRLTVGAL